MKRPWIFGLLMGVALGLAAGIGFYTFAYADGAAYFFNDPAACVNCHVMREQYDAWFKSPHRAVAACNDCHASGSLLSRYLTKATNGFWHSFAFTSGRFPEPIRIRPRNVIVAERACRSCHADLVGELEQAHVQEAQSVICLRCHSDTGHF